MSEELRLQILFILREHYKSGTGEIPEDIEIAQKLSQSVSDIQTELSILKAQGFVVLYKTFGSPDTAAITPKGLRYLKQSEG